MFLKNKISILVIIILAFSVEASSQYYFTSFNKDGATIAIGAGLTGLGFLLDTNSDNPSLSEINMLDPNGLNFLDRGAIDNYSSRAQTVSDILLYSSATLPFITYFSKKCRADGGSIAIMALETALITNGITNIIKVSADRYRPFNYNPNVDIEMKLGSDSNRSFVSGHTSNTTAFAFLTARIITDLHPEMNKKLVWATAATIPAVIGYLRVRAGKHFPTDVIGGYAIGAAVGYLIPSMHLVKNNNLTIQTVGIAGTRLVLNF